jgi:hypothetical protein
MKKLFLTLLFIPWLVLASDQYIHPGGLNTVLQRWDYPDNATMGGDTGFFNQDIGKLAFIPNNTFAGAGSLWRLGDIQPTWAWVGGDPLRWIDGANTMLFERNVNAETTFYIKNNNSGANAIASATVQGNDSVFTAKVYSTGYVGGGVNVVDGVTLTQDRGPIILNGNGSGTGAIRIADNGTFYSAGLLEVGTSGKVTSNGNWLSDGFGGYGYTKNQNASVTLGVTNNNGGTSSLAQIQVCSNGPCGDIATFPPSYVAGTVNVANSTKFASVGQNTISASGAIVFTNDGESTETARIDTKPIGYKGPISPRVVSVATALSLTPNADTTDLTKLTALASTCTINAPSGSPQDGQLLKFYINDNGTSRALTWNAIYTNSPPAATGIKKNIVWFQYNTTTSNWEKVVAQQF